MMRAASTALLLFYSVAPATCIAEVFDGAFVSGTSTNAAGAEALKLIDLARRSLGEGKAVEYEIQTMPMLYKGSEDGVLEGPTWGCYWTQNSCARAPSNFSLSLRLHYM